MDANSMVAQAQEYTLADEHAFVTFEGYLLATASSWDPNKKRWSEISIYKTMSGKYVVHGIGRTAVPGEEDRPWCSVADEACGVVSRLTRTSNGVSFMPRSPNRAVAERAAVIDDAIHDAYYSQKIA